MKKARTKALLDASKANCSYLRRLVYSLQDENLDLRGELNHLVAEIAILESELDGLRMVELDMSLTEEQAKVYEEGMKVINDEEKWNIPIGPVVNTGLFRCMDDEEMRKFILSIMEEVVTNAMQG